MQLAYETLLKLNNVSRTEMNIFLQCVRYQDDQGQVIGAYYRYFMKLLGEASEETAYQVIKEFCEEYLGDDFDYVFSIHNDQKHMHGHIVFNSVNRMSGYKYRYENGDWEKFIQPITDRICERHGLPPLEFECLMEKNGFITI